MTTDEFLTALFDGVTEGYIEFRPAVAPSVFVPLARWIPMCETAEHLFALDDNPSWQPFFGVAPRKLATRGTADNVACITAVIADVDFKKAGEDAAVEAVAAHPFMPSIIVNSGGGLHLYWLLDTPLYDLPRATRLLLNWGATVPASDIVFDLPRVLRLPGTLNRKYDPPRLAACEVFDPTLRYTVDELEAYAASVKPRESQKTQGVSLMQAGGGFELPASIGGGDRHGTLFRFVRSVQARYNLSWAELWPLVEAINDTRCEEPISRGDLQSWLRRAMRTSHAEGFGGK